jgi:hypothetical protein
MEKENTGFKELHLLMQNKDRKDDLLDKDKTSEKDELELLAEMQKREKDLKDLLNERKRIAGFTTTI